MIYNAKRDRKNRKAVLVMADKHQWYHMTHTELKLDGIGEQFGEDAKQRVMEELEDTNAGVTQKGMMLVCRGAQRPRQAAHMLPPHPRGAL